MFSKTSQLKVPLIVIITVIGTVQIIWHLKPHELLTRTSNPANLTPLLKSEPMLRGTRKCQIRREFLENHVESSNSILDSDSDFSLKTGERRR